MSNSFLLKSLIAAIIVSLLGGLYAYKNQSHAVEETHTSSPSSIYPPLEAIPEPTTVVIDLSANVRDAPSENASVVENIKVGELLTIVATQGSWVKVRRGQTVIGWIHKTSLSEP